MVQGLAAGGVTIVATIHSPTAYAFSLFDSLMMLVRMYGYACRRPCVDVSWMRAHPAAKCLAGSVSMTWLCGLQVACLVEATGGVSNVWTRTQQRAGLRRGMAATAAPCVLTLPEPGCLAATLLPASPPAAPVQVRGRVVYFGPTGNGCTDYLKGIDSSYHAKGKDASSKTSAPAVPLLNAVQSQQLADGSVVGLNPAEWLVDLFTQADREGRGADFADAYDASQLKQVMRTAAGMCCCQQPHLAAGTAAHGPVPQ